ASPNNAVPYSGWPSNSANLVNTPTTCGEPALSTETPKPASSSGPPKRRTHDGAPADVYFPTYPSFPPVLFTVTPPKRAGKPGESWNEPVTSTLSALSIATDAATSALPPLPSEYDHMWAPVAPEYLTTYAAPGPSPASVAPPMSIVPEI